MKTLAASLVLCVALAGCNTMAGLGQDMQQAGANLQQEAGGPQQDMAGSQQSMAGGYNDQLYNPMSPPNYTPPPGPSPIQV